MIGKIIFSQITLPQIKNIENGFKLDYHLFNQGRQAI